MSCQCSTIIYVCSDSKTVSLNETVNYQNEGLHAEWPTIKAAALAPSFATLTCPIIYINVQPAPQITAELMMSLIKEL